MRHEFPQPCGTPSAAKLLVCCVFREVSIIGLSQLEARSSKLEAECESREHEGRLEVGTDRDRDRGEDGIRKKSPIWKTTTKKKIAIAKK